MLDVDALYRERSDDLYRTLRRRFDRSVPDQLIEDACQAAWLIAWRCRDRLGDECPMAWLVAVLEQKPSPALRPVEANPSRSPFAAAAVRTHLQALWHGPEFPLGGGDHRYGGGHGSRSHGVLLIENDA